MSINWQESEEVFVKRLKRRESSRVFYGVAWVLVGLTMVFLSVLLFQKAADAVGRGQYLEAPGDLDARMLDALSPGGMPNQALNQFAQAGQPEADTIRLMNQRDKKLFYVRGTMVGLSVGGMLVAGLFIGGLGGFMLIGGRSHRMLLERLKQEQAETDSSAQAEATA